MNKLGNQLNNKNNKINNQKLQLRQILVIKKIKNRKIIRNKNKGIRKKMMMNSKKLVIFVEYMIKISQKNR